MINVDKMLFLLDSPLAKIFNRDVYLYHGSCYDIKGDKLKPRGVNVGATKYSYPRWSTFFWNDRDLAIKWAMSCTIGRRGTPYSTIYVGQNDKVLIFDRLDLFTTQDELFDKILEEDMFTYVYTVKVPASKVEVGSCATIEEYTVSETVPIYEREKIKITREMLDEYFMLISEEEYDRIMDGMVNIIENQPRIRNPILNMILDDYRDLYRHEVRALLSSGDIKEGDDISHMKKHINDAIKNDMYGIKKK